MLTEHEALVEQRIEELPMIAFADRLPVRDEMNGEQTILTYSENVGVFDLEFFESGWDFPERWIGSTHWLDITGMWPGVTAQVTEFRTTDAARIAALEAALKPFAARAEKLDGKWLNHETHWSPAYGSTAITIGDLRHASATLRSNTNETW